MASPAPASTSANPYSQAVAAARLANAAEREAERAEAVVRLASDSSFDSLRPKQASQVISDRAARALAESALRRLKRWCDPTTGGLDVGDRDGLLRQAQIMNISPAAAERVLAGVEAAWIARPRPAAIEPEPTASRAWWRRLRPRTIRIVLALALVVATLLILQIRMLGLWSELLHGG